MNLVMSKYPANIPNSCIIQKNSSNLADFQIFFFIVWGSSSQVL